MSDTRYIEINSSYRDRETFPNPAQFEVLLAQSGSRRAIDARDPVSDSAIMNQFTMNFDFHTDFNVATLVLVAVPSIGGDTATATKPTVATILASNVAAITANPASATSNVSVLVLFRAHGNTGGFSALTPGAGVLSRIEDYYVGAVFEYMTAAAPAVSAGQHRIINYQYVSMQGTFGSWTGDIGLFTLENALGASFAQGDTCYILNSTSFADISNPKIYVPGQPLITDLYSGDIIYNETLSQTSSINDSRPVTKFNPTTKLLTVNTTTDGVTTNWLGTHTYSLRNKNPNQVGSLTTLWTASWPATPNPPSTNTVSVLTSYPGIMPNIIGSFIRFPDFRFYPTSATTAAVVIPLGFGDIDFTGHVIYSYHNTDPEIRMIVHYSLTTRIATVGCVFSASPGLISIKNVSDSSISRRVVKQNNRTDRLTTGILTGATSVTLPTSMQNGDFIGMYFYGLAPNATNPCLITAYNQTTRLAIFSAGISGNIPVSGQFRINGCTVYPPFPTNVIPGGIVPGKGILSTQLIPFEILPFTTDNWVPLVYTGSLVSQQQMVCYQIELINLVLPNRVLKVSRGGRIAFYPYVYVEFRNLSGSSSGATNIIYSNNPNATTALFRCAIDDVPNPLMSPFIKIDGDGSVATVKFKPNDNFRFSVFLPSGEVFEVATNLNFHTQEHFSPNISNDFNQISALFSIKRGA